jgi:glycosyltransferase involved in cell wall biosynthesis
MIGLRVAYILNSAKVGGANRSLICLWEALRNTKIKPFIVGLEDGPISEDLKSTGFNYTVLKTTQLEISKPLGGLTSLLRIVWYLKKKEISIVHANDVLTARLFALAAKIQNIPILCHIHFDQGKELHEWVFRYFPKPDAFLFCSAGLQKEVGARILKKCPFAFQEVVHNAIDLERFPVRKTNNKIPRVGIIANLWKVKGHEDFLKMASILIEDGRSIAFDVVGGDLSNTGRIDELRMYAKNLGIQNHVTFHGYVSDVTGILCDLDIVVCSSHVEPFGICLIEAMASGKPIVATKVGGIVEVVKNDQTGILVDPRNPDQLAKAVAILLDNKDMNRAFGRNGRNRVEKYFSKEAYGRKMAGIYERLIS